MSKNNKKIEKILNESFFLNSDHTVEIVTRENFKDKYKEKNHEYILIPAEISSPKYVIVDKSLHNIDYFKLTFDVYMTSYIDFEKFKKDYDYGVYTNINDYEREFEFESDNFFDIYRVLHSIISMQSIIDCDISGGCFDGNEPIVVKFLIKRPKLILSRKGVVEEVELFYNNVSKLDYEIDEFFDALSSALTNSKKKSVIKPYSKSKSIVIDSQNNKWHYDYFDFDKFDSVPYEYAGGRHLLMVNCVPFCSITFATYEEMMYLSFISYAEIISASYITIKSKQDLEDPKYLYEIDNNVEDFNIYRVYSYGAYSREEIMCKLTYMDKFEDVVYLVSSILDGDLVDSIITQLTSDVSTNEKTVWVAHASNRFDRPSKKTFREKFMKKLEDVVNGEDEGFEFNPAILPF